MRWCAWFWLAGLTGAIVAGFWCFPIEDSYGEFDLATGSLRSRHVRFGIFGGDWEERPGWVSVRARTLGITYKPEWTFISHTSRTLVTTTHHCALTPKSYGLSGPEPEDVKARDTFVRDYVVADERDRERLLEKFRQ